MSSATSKKQTDQRQGEQETTKYRMQYEVDEVGHRLLENIKTRASIATTKDLFGYATTLFIWAVEEAEAGRMVGTFDEKDNKFRFFQMPPLLAAKARAEMAKKRHGEAA